MTYELRTAEMWPDADYELRAVAEGFTFEGYAAVFDLPSRLMAFPAIRAGQPFREVIHRGAFTKTLSENPDITLRYQHNLTALPLGRTTAGTLELSEDDRGLRVRASLPDNEWGRPVRDAIARGDITGMSFRFHKVIDKFANETRGLMRHLHEVKLDKEVSITDMPAFPDTVAAVRLLAQEAEVEPDELSDAFGALRDPEARLTPEQRDLLVTVINKHTDAPVIDVSGAQKLAQMRERLERLAG